AGLHEQTVHAVGHDRTGPAHVGRDDWCLERHGFEHRVRASLSVGGLHVGIECAVKSNDVRAVSEQADGGVDLKPSSPIFQGRPKASVAANHEPEAWPPPAKAGECYEQQIEALFALKTSDGTDHDVVRPESELGPDIGGGTAIALKGVRINRVGDDAYP